jgi:hypothetical protein
MRNAYNILVRYPKQKKFWRREESNNVAYSLKARIVEPQQRAVTSQRSVNNKQKNGVFCAIRADGCAGNSGIRHANAKQQLHFKRGRVFFTRFLP